MNNCTISVYLAYAMSVYCLACLFYLAFTRCMKTPFKASLTEEQLQILLKAKRQRRNVFLVGISLASYLLYVTKPFSKCPAKCCK